MYSKLNIYTQRFGNWFEWLAFFTLLAALFFSYHSRIMPENIILYKETPHINYGLRIFLTRSLIISSLTLTLLSVSLKGYLHLPSRQIVVPLLIYLSLVILSISISSYTFGSIQATVNICLWCSGFFIAAHLCSSQKRRLLLIYSIHILALAMSAYGISQALGYYPSYLNLYGSIESFYFQSNHYAGFLEIVIPISLANAFYQKRLYLKIMLWLLTILLLINVVLTDSRGGQLATGCACLGLLIFWANQRWSKVSKYFFLILILASIGAGIFLLANHLPTVKEVLTNFYSKLQLDKSLEQRLVIWRVSLAAIGEQPWLGWGAGNFIETIAMHRSAFTMSELEPLFDIIVTYAHSDYLQIAVETGLLSLAALIYFWFAVLLMPKGNKDFKGPGITHGILAGLMALLMHGFLEGNISIIPATALLAYVLAGFLHSFRAS